MTDIDGTASAVVQAIADLDTDPTGFNVSISGTTAAASALTSIDDATVGDITATSITAVTGTAAEVASLADAVSNGTIIMANWSTTASPLTVVQANTIDAANGTGEITATISDGGTSDLVQLTGNHAYSITLTDTSADAADLNTINAATGVKVNATAVNTLTGSEADILTLSAALVADTVDIAASYEIQTDFGASIDFTATQIGTLDTYGLSQFDEVGGDNMYTVTYAQYQAVETAGVTFDATDIVGVYATGGADTIDSSQFDGTMKVVYSPTVGSPAATWSFQEDGGGTTPPLDANDYWTTGGSTSVDVVTVDANDVIDLTDYALTSRAINSDVFTGTGTKLGNGQWAVVKGTWDSGADRFHYDTTGDDVLVLWDADTTASSSQVGVVLDSAALNGTDFYIQTAVGTEAEPLAGASLIVL